MLAFSSKKAQNSLVVLGNEATQLVLMPLLVIQLSKEDLGDVTSSHHNRLSTSTQHYLMEKTVVCIYIAEGNLRKQ